MAMAKQKAQKNLFILCLFLATSFSFSDTTDALQNTELDSVVFKELVQKGRLDRTAYKKDLEPILCPDTELGENLRKSWISEEEPVFIAESLFYLEKKEKESKTEIPLISKLMRRFSTMEGITYYSNSNEKVETLYSQSYTIENPKTMKKIPDQTEIPADKLTLYLYQKDNSFGKTVYEANINEHEKEVSMSLHNVEPIKFSFITAVKENNLTMSLLFIDKGDYILTYIFAQLKFPALAIFEEKVNESFRARIDAIYEWFRESYIAYNN